MHYEIVERPESLERVNLNGRRVGDWVLDSEGAVRVGRGVCFVTAVGLVLVPYNLKT
jgi:hypothetical protein